MPKNFFSSKSSKSSAAGSSAKDPSRHGLKWNPEGGLETKGGTMVLEVPQSTADAPTDGVRVRDYKPHIKSAAGTSVSNNPHASTAAASSSAQPPPSYWNPQTSVSAASTYNPLASLHTSPYPSDPPRSYYSSGGSAVPTQSANSYTHPVPSPYQQPHASMSSHPLGGHPYSQSVNSASGGTLRGREPSSARSAHERQGTTQNDFDESAKRKRLP